MDTANPTLNTLRPQCPLPGIYSFGKPLAVHFNPEDEEDEHLLVARVHAALPSSQARPGDIGERGGAADGGGGVCA